MLSTLYKSIDPTSEECYYIEHSAPLLDYLHILQQLCQTIHTTSQLPINGDTNIYEIGPLLNRVTPWSTNAVTILHRIGLTFVTRLEKSLRQICVTMPHFNKLSHQIYPSNLASAAFLSNKNSQLIQTDQLYPVPDLAQFNQKFGLGFDAQDMTYYSAMFVDREIPGNNIEFYDLAQSNSEHSRHWFFNGKMVIDGVGQEKTLFQLVKEPLFIKKQTSEIEDNSLIAFSDNSSAIRGYDIRQLIPQTGQQYDVNTVTYHPTFTAETHNFPTGIEPFSGATTGIGGRIRDGQAIGRGGLTIAGTAGYCIGDLFHQLPFEYGDKYAKPLDILIHASNGASDYGNKFGEPIIQGFTRSFAQLVGPHNARREWIKPIMFTGGIGQIDDRLIHKQTPIPQDLIVKIGGPAYKIGLGGGAASSSDQGVNQYDSDLHAVQRGDPEMQQKMHRVIRACIELGHQNPISSIHDQGAGGNGNVLKELVYPIGGIVRLDQFTTGEPLTPLELWCAEYQESNALLVQPSNIEKLQSLAHRENVTIDIVGSVVQSGHMDLFKQDWNTHIYSIELEKVLGSTSAQKIYQLSKSPHMGTCMHLTSNNPTILKKMIHQVLRNITVGSKRFLTNKVDRSVTGLIAQQQCVGPFHTPLANVAVVAQSHLGFTGIASAIGEQPIKGFLNPGAMARLTVAESLTNLMWARISRFEDIKYSGNWMWPAKHPGEGAAMYETAVALNRILIELELAIDGGKDSLSMSAKIDTQDVLAPRSLVMSAYVTCPDIRLKVTPDLKSHHSCLLHVDLGLAQKRLGGSILFQEYNQIGHESTRLGSSNSIKKVFNLVQQLLVEGLILAGHDCSDGGLITTLVEMALAGNKPVKINLAKTERS